MHDRLLLSAAALLSLASLVACSGGSGGGSGGGDGDGTGGAATPPSIDLADYDRSCTADADCVLATSGSACRVCACPDGAINKKDEARYRSDGSAAAKQCPPMPDVVCGPCQEQKAACTGGMCVAVDVM